MDKKYIVYPDYVFSEHDAQRHYVDFTTLCHLYNVNPNECICVDRPEKAMGLDLSKYKILRVREDGRYQHQKELVNDKLKTDQVNMDEDKHLEIPSPEDCESGKHLGTATTGAELYATWYPQMGGYVARCVIALYDNGCFDAYIWHDGDFPFTDEPPHHLHHCDAQQFIDFGNFVLSKQGERDE